MMMIMPLADCIEEREAPHPNASHERKVETKTIQVRAHTEKLDCGNMMQLRKLGVVSHKCDLQLLGAKRVGEKILVCC